MGMGTGTGRAWVLPLCTAPPSCPQAHLHPGLSRVRLHGLQCDQGPAALHDDPAVLRLSQGQDAQGRAALLTYLWGSQMAETVRCPSSRGPAMATTINSPGECPAVSPGETAASPCIYQISHNRNHKNINHALRGDGLNLGLVRAPPQP